MNETDSEQLKAHIAHIFESGANEIRIFEMVKTFIRNRANIEIERLVWKEKFPDEEFDWDSYYDWVNENPQDAYNAVIHILNKRYLLIREL